MDTETKFDELKAALIKSGKPELEQFLDHELPPGLTDSQISALLDRAWLDMPWPVLREYYERYGISLT